MRRGPERLVYVTDYFNHRVQYFNSAGSFDGSWGQEGIGEGEFRCPLGVDVSPAAIVFVVDEGNNRVQYFTLKGKFLGKWGSYGPQEGQFNQPDFIAVSSTGARVYVADEDNDRVQYFNRNKPAVVPESLGKVKALFR